MQSPSFCSSCFAVSSIKETKPVDWERPRHIDIIFESKHGIREASVEFDTIEAARDWRNELRGVYLSFPPLAPFDIKGASPVGAIFLHRRNRHAVLDPTEDVDGIRLNIPFSRIGGASKSPCLSFACMVSITISAEVAPNEAATSPAVEIDSYSDGTLSERGEVVTPDSEAEPYVVQLSIIRKHPLWDDFMSYVEKAKAAMAADTTEWPGSTVHIDFDPRTDIGREESETSGLSSLQISVSRALGLDPTKEFFSE